MFLFNEQLRNTITDIHNEAEHFNCNNDIRFILKTSNSHNGIKHYNYD